MNPPQATTTNGACRGHPALEKREQPLMTGAPCTPNPAQGTYSAAADPLAGGGGAVCYIPMNLTPVSARPYGSRSLGPSDNELSALRAADSRHPLFVPLSLVTSGAYADRRSQGRRSWEDWGLDRP